MEHATPIAMMGTALTGDEAPAAEPARRWLASGTVPGVGRRTAEKIAARFGARLPEILKHAPARLAETPGTPAHLAGMIGRAWRLDAELRAAMARAQALGAEPELGIALHRRFGPRTLATIAARLRGVRGPEAVVAALVDLAETGR